MSSFTVKQLLLAVTCGLAAIPALATLPAVAGTQVTFDLGQCFPKNSTNMTCTRNGVTVTPSIFVPARTGMNFTRNTTSGLGVTKGWGEQVDSGSRTSTGYGSSTGTGDDEILILRFTDALSGAPIAVRVVGGIFTDSNNDTDAFRILLGDLVGGLPVVTKDSPMLVQDFVTVKSLSGYQTAVSPSTSDPALDRNNGNGRGTFNFSGLAAVNPYTPSSVYGFSVPDLSSGSSDPVKVYDASKGGWGQSSYRVRSVTVELP